MQGVIILSEQPFMKFEIREKVSNLKEGKSFHQLSSLELQPIVKIYESEQNIDVSGYLVLNGEFYREDVGEEWEDEYEESDGVHSGSIFDQSDEPLLFQYQIPISIQIQANRVAEPSQVYVDIDYFDYNVLSEQEIELVVHIRLLGVHPYIEQDTPINWTEGDSDAIESSVKSLLGESASSQEVYAHVDPINREGAAVILDDVEKDEKAENTESMQEELATGVQNVEEGSEKPIVNETEIEETEVVETVTDVQQIEEQEPPKMKIGFKKKDSDPRQNEIKSPNPLYSLMKNEKTTPVIDDQPTEISTFNNVDEVDTVEETQEELETKISENSGSLIYSLLQDNKESRATLKLYFVQKEDSLQSISEKYSIKVQSIMNKNKLNSEEIHEGQILYLPTEG